MRKLVVGCLFLIGLTSQAQVRNALDQLDNTGAGGSLLRNRVLNKPKEKIVGIPYLNEVFMSSSISGVENVFLTRYNAHSDEVEVSYDNATFVIPKEERYSTIINKTLDYKLQLLRYNSDKENYVYGYLFELYANEKVGVYKRQQIMLQEAREAPNGYSLPVPPKYNQKSDEYYLKMDETKVIPFPKNKKTLVNLYPSSEKAIVAYLKAEKISFKDEGDMIKLTKFLATL